jgi:hypothetical protein
MQFCEGIAINTMIELGDLKKSWLQAVQDLGIEVITDARIAGRERIVVKSFGGKLGTVIGKIGEFKKEEIKVFEKEGFYLSELGNSYWQYDRQLFIDTLNDWGFLGENSDSPKWYTGKPWE